MGKYCKDESFLTVTEKKAISHGWRGVLLGRDLIMSNAGWVVGDGRSVRAWHDPWLSVTEQKRPVGPPTEASSNITVADLLRPDSREWNDHKI